MRQPRSWVPVLLAVLGFTPLLVSEVVAQSRGRGQGQTTDVLRFPDLSQRPVFLTGQVLMEDGTPPPEPVIVSGECGAGQPLPQGYTDADGQFSINLGNPTTPMMDIQNPSGRVDNRRDFTGCELKAIATGYTSDPIDLTNRRVLDSPEVGTIILRPLEGVVGSAFSRTTLNARKEAREAYEKGREKAGRKEYDEALEEYEKAVQVAPGFAAAWFELGLVHQIQNHAEEARSAYEKSIEADPEFVKPYRQLAFIAFHTQDWPAVLKATDELLWLDPVSYPDGYFFDATAHFYLGELEEAEKSARKVVEMDADHRFPRARLVLGAILIDKQDYAGAAKQLRIYVETAEPGPEVEQARAMLAQLEAR